jgi:hypothetical protein
MNLLFFIDVAMIFLTAYVEEHDFNVIDDHRVIFNIVNSLSDYRNEVPDRMVFHRYYFNHAL